MSCRVEISNLQIGDIYVNMQHFRYIRHSKPFLAGEADETATSLSPPGRLMLQ